MQELGVRLVDHPVAAAGDLFVVADPGALFMIGDFAAPGALVQLVAILTGGTVMDVGFLFSGGTAGSNITYRAATKVKRSVYITPGVYASMPEVSVTMQSIIESYSGCVWRLLMTEPVATDLQADCLILATGDEKRTDDEWSGCRYVFTLSGFLAYVLKLDAAASSSGLCGH